MSEGIHITASANRLPQGRNLTHAKSPVRVSNPEQVVQPKQASLSRDGVGMGYRRERHILGV